MKFLWEFIPPDSVVRSEGTRLLLETHEKNEPTSGPISWEKSNTVVCDTGNALGDGVIDHQQPEVEGTCSTSLVAFAPERYLAHLDPNAQQITIVTRHEPDLDTLGALFLIRQYLSEGSLPDYSQTLSRYIYDVDTGRLSLNPIFPLSFAAVMLIIIRTESELNNARQRSLKILKKGFKTLERITPLLRSHDPRARDFLTGLDGFEKILNKIQQDRLLYIDDIGNHSRICKFPLFNHAHGVIEEVDTLISQNPKSILWSYWARGDHIYAPGKTGFTLTCRFSDLGERTRASIAVDANVPYELKGLGLLLEKMELERIQETAPLKKETLTSPQKGYFRSLHWYDGRDRPHPFTILVAPRGGSALTQTEIEHTLFRFELWQDLGKHHELYDQPESLLKIPIYPDIDPPDLDEVFENFRSSKYYVLKRDFAKITEAAGILKCRPLLDDIAYIEQIELRQEIVDALMGFYNRISPARRMDWEIKLSQLFVNFFPSRYLEQFLLKAESLSSGVLDICLYNLLPEYPGERIIPFLLNLQTKHTKSFNTWVHAIKKRKKTMHCSRDFGTKNLNTLMRHYVSRLYQPNVPSETREAVPIYSFDRIKNYFDDLILTADLTPNRPPDKEAFQYIAQDFQQLWEKGSRYIHLDSNDILKLRKEFLRLFRENVHPGLFGNDLKKFRELRTQILSSRDSKLFGMYSRWDPEEYFHVSRTELRKCYTYLKSRFRDTSVEQKEFLIQVNLIDGSRVLENLILRLTVLFQIRSINENTQIKKFLIQNHPDLYEFQNFLILLMEGCITYSNSAQEKISQEKLRAAQNSLNKLKIHPSSSSYFDIPNITDDLYRFISNLIKNREVPVRAIRRNLDLAIEQYGSITGGGGLLAKAAKLPYFYREFLNEILYAYKRFYQEAIEFYQNRVLYATESLSADNSSFLNSCNFLLNQSVYFDWQEIKQMVDEEGDAQTANDFYRKYFSWQRLCEQAGPELNRRNSNIRSVVGRILSGPGQLRTRLGLLLPESPQEAKSSFKEFGDYYIANLNISKLINHFPLSMYINSYDYLTDFYLQKFDVLNVSITLDDFSTKFPWYSRFLSRVSRLRGVVLGLAGALWGAFLFHESSGAKITGLGTPGILLHICLDYFWKFLMALVMVLPPLIAVSLFYKKYFAPKWRKQNRVFLDLFQKIDRKRYSLLFFQFTSPLILVVLETFKSNLFKTIAVMDPVSYVCTILLLTFFVYVSLYREVAIQNPEKGPAWIFRRSDYMFWLYFLQAFLICIFLINLITPLNMLGKLPATETAGLISIQWTSISNSFSIYLHPKLTILVSVLTLFMSLFIKKVFQK